MKICVVGGGVAGLQVADILTESGHECHIFEREASVGGMWRKNYIGYALQVPMELYEFPGMPLPNKEGTFPDGKAVLEYIQAYVKERKLLNRCTFHLAEAVEKMTHDDCEWKVKTSKESYVFDFCVVCTGMYNTPHVPFANDKTIHSSEFVEESIIVGKHVTVVGAGKSAIDCAVVAAKYAMSVTLMSRKMHWPVPRYIAGVMPFKWGTYSRLGHFLLPSHWDISSTEGVLHRTFGWLKWSVWRLLERVFSFQFRLDTHPSTPLEIDLFNGGQILTTEFRDAVDGKKIKLEAFSEVALNSADVIISATGFKKDYTIFDDETLSRLDLQDDGLWLYKNIIPPQVSLLAFIGSEVSTFNNILTHHIPAQWLKHMRNDDYPPSPGVMEHAVQREKDWKRSWMPHTTSRAALIQLHMTKYHDTLMKDMNRNPVCQRIWEWVLPHTARDYKAVFGGVVRGGRPYGPTQLCKTVVPLSLRD